MIAFATLALVNLLTLTLAGFVALHFAHKNAVEGYEDATGFHTGIQPRPGRGATVRALIHRGTDRAA